LLRLRMHAPDLPPLLNPSLLLPPPFVLPSPIPPPPSSTLFPYTTLFRSRRRSSPRTSPWSCPCSASSSPSSPAPADSASQPPSRSEEHTSELQSRFDLVCRLLLEKKKNCLQRASHLEDKTPHTLTKGLAS